MDSRPSRRTENRTPLEVAITLVSLDLASYEVTTTRDVSLHGASVSTRQQWAPNLRIDVRSLQGSFSGFARVVHCRQEKGTHSFSGFARVVHCRQEKGTHFVMGLEFFFTDGQWKQDHGHSGAAAAG